MQAEPEQIVIIVFSHWAGGKTTTVETIEERLGGPGQVDVESDRNHLGREVIAEVRRVYHEEDHEGVTHLVSDTGKATIILKEGEILDAVQEDSVYIGPLPDNICYVRGLREMGRIAKERQEGIGENPLVMEIALSWNSMLEEGEGQRVCIQK